MTNICAERLVSGKKISQILPSIFSRLVPSKRIIPLEGDIASGKEFSTAISVNSFLVITSSRSEAYV